MRTNFKTFFQKFDSENFPVYFLTGPEDFLKFRAREKILKSNKFKDYKKTFYEGQKLDCSELSNNVQSQDMFSSGEIFIISSADVVKGNKKKELIDILENFENAGVRDKIIILSSNKTRSDIDDPLEGYLIASKSALHVYFPILTLGEVVAWASGELKRSSLYLDPYVLDIISQKYQNQLYLWAQFIERLKLFSPDGRNVTDAEALTLVGEECPEDPGHLHLKNSFMSIFATDTNNPASAMHQSLERVNSEITLHHSSESQAALKVLKVLQDAVFEIARDKSGANYGFTRRRIDEGYQARIKNASSRLDWGNIEVCLGIILEAERNIKTGAITPGLAAKECVTRLWEETLA
ncbi:DNA polymerase III subunit delta [Elusimicrobiota bacterium]